MNDKMNDKRFDDFLQQQLQSSSHYLDDGDFSARVLAGLPVQKRLNLWLEKLIVWVPVTLIAILVVSQLPVRDFIQPIYAWVLMFDMNSLIILAQATVTIMLAVPLFFVLRRTSLF